jgi:hypothetical protein
MRRVRFSLIGVLKAVSALMGLVGVAGGKGMVGAAFAAPPGVAGVLVCLLLVGERISTTTGGVAAVEWRCLRENGILNNLGLIGGVS